MRLFLIGELKIRNRFTDVKSYVFGDGRGVGYDSYVHDHPAYGTIP